MKIKEKGIRITSRVICSMECRCGKKVEAELFEGKNISEIRDYFDQIGWQLIHNEVMCPKCAEREMNAYTE